MEVKELRLRGFCGLPAGDGSYRLIKYKQAENLRELVELKHSVSWEPTGDYRLKINLPPLREIEAVIIVIKTSANCYKVTHTNAKQSGIETFKNYAEIDEFLKQYESSLVK